MRMTIDTTAKTIETEGGTIDLYGREAFDIAANLWLKTSWNQRYSYTFTWMGRPVIQHPDDMIRLQEVIYTLKPDVIVETGVAHGGSLIYSASLLRAMGRPGKVIGVDIEIRPHNRKAIEAHELSRDIVLIEGDSAAREVVSQVEAHIKPTDVVLVILDSNHSYDHVTKELDAYAHLVTPGSYAVATDGIMEIVFDVPRGQQAWERDNPSQAAVDFAGRRPDFVVEEPAWLFNESELDKAVTAWPNAWLKRVAPEAAR